MPPAPELTRALSHQTPGRALDIACGSGRHSLWLAHCGWQVTAVDREPVDLPGVTFDPIDLESHQLPIGIAAWDLIVCWLYWQPDLLPSIAEGVRDGGLVALAGKTSGRFATSLALFREAFPSWPEVASGEDESRAFLIARKPAAVNHVLP